MSGYVNNLPLSKRIRGHFHTVMTHKKVVARDCFRLGLYRQGILHDMSKFSPTEFLTGIKYYSGKVSPNAEERRDIGMSRAWLHHKGRNLHHFEYWMDTSKLPGKAVYGSRMPLRYVAEMVCDRHAACIAYQGDAYTCRSAWEYYLWEREIDIINPDTKAILEYALKLMADEGEEACFTWVRSILKKTKDIDYCAADFGLSYEPLADSNEGGTNPYTYKK